MEPNSFDYLVFFPVAFLVHILTPAPRRWITVVATGVAFLLHHSPFALAVLLAVTVLNYLGALAMERWSERQGGTIALAVTIGLDVLALVTLRNVDAAGWRTASGGRAASLLGIAVPLGLSYYTFQLIGYCLEVHWGRESAERRPGRLLASVILFPKLVAGPIERPHRLLPQLEAPAITAEKVWSGLRQIGAGLFKKSVLADRMALVVDDAYANIHAYQGPPLAAVIFLYAFEGYMDFSGYTDIALGSARVLGYELSPNFREPFAATNIGEFWRRWHISLSSWTNEYIVRPLSALLALRTPFPRAAVPVAIFVSFVVLGAWHGFHLNYLLFGAAHGVAVAAWTVARQVRWTRPPWLSEAATARLGNLATVTFYAGTCVFFRARTPKDAFYVLGNALVPHFSPAAAALLRAHRLHLAELAVLTGLGSVAGILSADGWRAPAFAAKRPWQRACVFYFIVAAIVVFGVFKSKKFVYANF